MEEVLLLMRVAVSLGFMAYSSWSDIKTREVSNSVWIIFAPIAFVLTIADLLLFPSASLTRSVFDYGVSVGITSAFSIVLFYVGAFGGADAKALMCLSLAIPAIPHLIAPLSGFVSPIFPITVFSNSVIIAACSVFYALSRNLVWRLRSGKRFFEGLESESFARKALALLSGYKVAPQDLEGSFLYPLEDVQTTDEGETKRSLLIFPTEDRREEITQRVSTATGDGSTGTSVWATPGLPMLVFITVGLVLALTVGDVVWIVISRVIS